MFTQEAGDRGSRSDPHTDLNTEGDDSRSQGDPPSGSNTEQGRVDEDSEHVGMEQLAYSTPFLSPMDYIVPDPRPL